MKRFSGIRRLEAGISLVETMVAVGITVTSMMAFSTSVQQAQRVARSGKAVASAAALLQERMEAFRQSTTWSNVTTAAGIASVTGAASAGAASFPGVTETFTVQPYPSGSQLVVTRSTNGTFSNNGVTLGTTNCVKLTIAVAWSGAGGRTQTEQVTTIIAKGGL